MKRFLRWAFVLLLLAGAAAAVSAYLLHQRLRAKPTWYARPALDPESQRLMANSVDQKLVGIYSAARRAQAQPAPPPPGLDDPPASQPSPITIELSEDEINAFFAKWQEKFGWKRNISAYVDDPVIVLNGRQLLLVGMVKSYNTVLTLHFDPRLENRKLRLSLSMITAGTLPVPRSYFAGYSQKITDSVNHKLPELRKQAEITPKGWANSAAVAASMEELLLHALNDEPAQPVLFIPEQGARHGRSLPMQITAVDVADKILTIKLQPMNPDEREALLQHIRGSELPAPSQTAMGK